MTSKTKHRRIRSTILQAAGKIEMAGRRRSNIVTDLDYTAVPPPINLRAQPAGNCLVWLWNVNDGGYGTGSFPDGEHLAHRQAYTQSRGHSPSQSVLHLCHRPFCIQPSHLYDGSALDNSRDRTLRTQEGVDFDLFNEKAEIVESISRHQWPSPQDAISRLLMISPVEHVCEYIIPAMDRNICPTCGREEFSDDAPTHFGGADQPDNTDRNESLILKSSRSFKDLPEGMTVESDTTSEISIPKTRAERRRRERAARKSPYRDKPKLLGSAVLPLKPGEPVRFESNFKKFAAPGPGLLVYTMRLIEADNLEVGI